MKDSDVLDFFEAQERRAMAGQRHAATKGLRPGFGGGNSGGMEARVAKLETDVAEIKSILARLAPRIDEMYGRIQHMPTLWQIAAIVLAINSGIVGVSAIGLHLLR